MTTPDRAHAAFRIMTDHLAGRLVKSKGRNHTSHEFFRQSGNVASIPQHAQRTLNMRHTGDDATFRRYFKMYTYKESDVKGLRTILSRKSVDANHMYKGDTLLSHLSNVEGPQATRMMKILLEFGANPNIVKLQSPLYWASDHDIERMELLLLAGANPNLGALSPLLRLFFKMKYSPSQTMANGLLKVKLLLKYGANPNAREVRYVNGKKGHTILMTAVTDFGHDVGMVMPLIKMLIEHGADVNAKSYSGTALGMAYKMAKMHPGTTSYREVIRYLLQHGADPKIPIPDFKQNVRTQLKEMYALAGLKA
jgi:hypothetical protein